MSRRDKVLRGVLSLLVLVMLAGGAAAQAPTGVFLCSAGSQDGAPCNTQEDCPGGVCVIAQGVCNGGTDDSFPCDCAGGTCSAQPVCASDATMGTCSGGPFAGGCCSTQTNCADAAPCIGSQKACIGGDNKGFSCLNNQQCPVNGGASFSQCRSTGKVCAGGTFNGFTCVTTADCPSGVCTGPTAPSPLPTATRTARPTTPPGTRVPTPTGPTRTATPTVPGETPPPTATPENTATPQATLIAPTSTPEPGTAIVRLFDPRDPQRIVVFDALQLPESGTLLLPDGEAIDYVENQRDPRILHLASPVQKPLQVGDVVSARQGRVDQAQGSGAGCSMAAPANANSSAVLLLVGVAAVSFRKLTR